MADKYVLIAIINIFSLGKKFEIKKKAGRNVFITN